MSDLRSIVETAPDALKPERAGGAATIAWQGAFLTRHSLALVNRELTTALAAQRPNWTIAPVQHVSDDGSLRTDPALRGLSERINAAPSADVWVRHGWPPDFARPACRAFVVSQPWEYGALPVDWLAGLQTVDEVWAPSRHVRDSYIRSGVDPERVAIVPNGVNTYRFRPGVVPMKLPTSRSFVFLFVGGTIRRKGIDVLLDAYGRAFRASDDVALVLKEFGSATFYAGRTADERIAAFQKTPGAPELVYINADLSDDEVASLYAACDCLVHPYRGEGYGLPIAEAMACGKPCIVTGYGAALDFATPDNAYLIPATEARMPEARIGCTPTVDLPWWAEPDRAALVELMQRVCADRAGAARVGEKAAADIFAKHTWSHAARAAAARIELLLANMPTLQPARPSPVVSKQAAMDALRDQDWDRAADLSARFLEASTDDPDLRNARAVALYRGGDAERAIDELRAQVAERPEHPGLRHNLATMLVESGPAPEAAAHALEAFKLAPEVPEVRHTLGRARSAAVRAARAIRKQAASRRGARENPLYRELVAVIERIDEAVRAAAVPSPSSRMQPTSSSPRVSLVMIARDEERFLAQCLRSARDAVDEIVVVDTGSSDRTTQIAEEFGARVVRHPWRDDFADARNVSLDHATGDWALWLDADEELATESARRIRELARTAPPYVGGFMATLRNFVDSPDGADVFFHRACRLFRRLPVTRFAGRIHEQNTQGLERAGYVIAASDITIEHHGYSGEVMAARNKHERFIGMLHREIDENPDDPLRFFQYYNLGNAYYIAGDMSSALGWLERAAQNPEQRTDYGPMLYIQWATTLYRTGRPEEALRVLDRAESLGMRNPGLLFVRGHTMLVLRRPDEAKGHFGAAMAEARRNPVLDVGDAASGSYKARFGLTLSCIALEEYAEGERHARAVLAEKPRFTEARFALAHTLWRQARHAEAAGEYDTVLAADPEHTQARAEHGCALAALGRYAEARDALLAVRDAMPDSLDACLSLASSSSCLGFHEEARDALLQARRLAPASAEIAVNLGRELWALGDATRALETFLEAASIDPSHANAYFNAADVLYGAGHYGDAASMAAAGLTRAPDHAPGLFVLGNCCMQSGDAEGACVAYRAALERRPDYAEARHNLQIAEEVAATQGQAA
ncbi:MAG TPA: tetratricopeptide repeat protein [Chthonomonadales bacterium]|nr:tetratricopeptide repeat protein [Chthonomonadales bacterium]